MREWLDDHAQDPYPTVGEKNDIAQILNISLQQVSTLFNNQRQRYKVLKLRDSLPNLLTDPEPVLVSPAKYSASLVVGEKKKKRRRKKHARGNQNSLSLMISGEEYYTESDFSPLDRYLSSSSDEDPQPIELVLKAARSRMLNSYDISSSSSRLEGRRLSATPIHSGSEISSRSDMSSTHSSVQSGRSGSTYRSGKRGKRLTTAARQKTDHVGHYYCTYCWKNFATSGSWRKHEIDVHRPQKEIECRMAELLPTPIDCGACFSLQCQKTQNGRDHKYNACSNRTKEARTFHRLDHFKNHLQGIHNADYTSHMENWWRPTSNNGRSRCGFCGQWFPTWIERLDHIGTHYRFHDDFDQSKWTLASEEENEGPNSSAQPEQASNNNNSSALVLSKNKNSAKIEIDPVFDPLFSYTGLLRSANYQDFTQWAAGLSLPAARASKLLTKHKRSMEVHPRARRSRNNLENFPQTQHALSDHSGPSREVQNHGHATDCFAHEKGMCKFDVLSWLDNLKDRDR